MIDQDSGQTPNNTSDDDDDDEVVSTTPQGTGDTPAEQNAGPSPTDAKQDEGATTVVGSHDGEAENLTVAADPEGVVSNRVEGTIQREPTPEEMPSDAKIAPLAEQVAPNQAAQAVGALQQPDEIAGVEQPKEGEKNLPVDGDTSDVTRLLPENSEQHEDAERVAEDAARDADRGRV